MGWNRRRVRMQGGTCGARTPECQLASDDFTIKGFTCSPPLACSNPSLAYKIPKAVSRKTHHSRSLRFRPHVPHEVLHVLDEELGLLPSREVPSFCVLLAPY